MTTPPSLTPDELQQLRAGHAKTCKRELQGESYCCNFDRDLYAAAPALLASADRVRELETNIYNLEMEANSSRETIATLRAELAEAKRNQCERSKYTLCSAMSVAEAINGYYFHCGQCDAYHAAPCGEEKP